MCPNKLYFYFLNLIKKNTSIRFLGLVDLDFNEEGIFWLKRSLAFYSRDDLEDRLYIFMRLYACYKKLENHEMVLEFGNKALELKSLMVEHNQIPEGPG